MQTNDEIKTLPAKGRIYRDAVESTALDMLYDDCGEEIAALFYDLLDPDKYADQQKRANMAIDRGLSNLVERYLENCFISVIEGGAYELPDDETVRSDFIFDVVLAIREYRRA
jgi:hypothetical protein